MNFSEVRTRLIAMGVNFFSADVFLAYHRERPLIWAEFEKAALELCSEGRERISAKHVCEKIRYEREFKKLGEFKISNSMVSLYARVFVMKHPQYSAKFVLKECVGPKQEAA